MEHMQMMCVLPSELIFILSSFQPTISNEAYVKYSLNGEILNDPYVTLTWKLLMEQYF